MFGLLGLIELAVPILMVVLIVVAVRQSGAASQLQSRLLEINAR